jgi:2'-5' RNA ligase
MTDKIRTFIAVALPGEIATAIDGVQRALASHDFRIRWVDPRKVHLTLRFLGDVPSAEIDTIAGATATAVAGHSPLTLHAAGLGVFPGFKRPRVIWVGLDGPLQALEDLQRDLEKQLAAVGYAPDKRPFKAHLTIGRVKGWIDSRRLVEAFQALQPFESPPFEVRQVVVFRSVLKPTGAEYMPMRVIHLNGGAARR